MIQTLGWLGSALIVASLTQTRAIPFRLLNLTSAIVLLAFNLAIGLWSMVVLNVVILIVDLRQLGILAGDAKSDSETVSAHPSSVTRPSITASTSPGPSPVTVTAGPRRRPPLLFGPSASVPFVHPGSDPVRRAQGARAARRIARQTRSRAA